MKILIFCESSGTVREAFRKLGHDAWSCDLLPADDGSHNHYQGDCREVIRMGWDIIVGHPPCTYLTSAGIHWNNRGRGWEKTESAVQFWEELVLLCTAHARVGWCLENPVGIMSRLYRKPEQYIQPHLFGHDASKKTGLWLHNLPRLTIDPAKAVAPRIVGGKPRWGNQTDSGQNRLAPSPTRWKERSKTYSGIASAMALAWGGRAE